MEDFIAINDKCLRDAANGLIDGSIFNSTQNLLS